MRGKERLSSEYPVRNIALYEFIYLYLDPSLRPVSLSDDLALVIYALHRTDVMGIIDF